MRKMMSGWIAAMFVVVFTNSLLAHHSLSNFDTTTAVRVTGVIVRFEQVNPHSILFVDAKGTDGQIQRWAVEGPGVRQLDRQGFTRETLKAGDVIEACGYVTKDGVESQRTVNTEPVSLSLKATSPKTITGRLLSGEQLVMPDGRKRTWSDYGQHKCFDQNYTDFHVR